MFWKKMSYPAVTFATTVWEKDWRQILLDPEYLPVRQIGNHLFPFAERLLIINNVEDAEGARRAAEKWVEKGVLSRVVTAEKGTLGFFGLEGLSGWFYYNAIGPLTAIRECATPFLVYLTGDVRLDGPLDWIRPSLLKMEQNRNFKVANPVWNGRYDEAKREAKGKSGPFYVGREGFSDQMFLVRTDDFRQPIYNETRGDAGHFPHGDTFEKRVFSYMKNRGWERIIFRRGSYTHENF